MTENKLRHKIEQLSDDERKILTLKVKEYVQNDVRNSKSDSQKRIVAYFKSNSAVNTDELKGYLKSQLPDYMIPTSLQQIENIPLLPNGKVDNKALLKIKHQKSELASDQSGITKPNSDI